MAKFPLITKEEDKKSTRYFQCEVKSVDRVEKGVKIRGYASTPDIDRVNDIVVPEAFKESIAEYINEGGAPALLRSHDKDRVVGVTLMEGDDAPEITKDGLIITALVTDEETAKQVEAGELRTFSIGYIPDWSSVEYDLRPTAKVERETGQRLYVEVRIIHNLDWVETSIVSTPANRKALFTLAKSVKDLFSLFPSPVMDNKCSVYPDLKAVGKIGDRWLSEKAIAEIEFKGAETPESMLFDTEAAAKAYAESNEEIKEYDVEEAKEGEETMYKLVNVKMDEEEEEDEGEEGEEGEKSAKTASKTTETEDENASAGDESEEGASEGGEGDDEKSLLSNLTPEQKKLVGAIVKTLSTDGDESEEEKSKTPAKKQSKKSKPAEGKDVELTTLDIVLPVCKIMAETIADQQKQLNDIARFLKTIPMLKGKSFISRSGSTIAKALFEETEEEKDTGAKLDKGFSSLLRSAQESGSDTLVFDSGEAED